MQAPGNIKLFRVTPLGYETAGLGGWFTRTRLRYDMSARKVQYMCVGAGTKKRKNDLRFSVWEFREK